MNRTELLNRLQDIFRQELQDESITLTEETTAEDVNGWTSLTHAQLINNIEEQMNIHFSVREMMGWQNVGEIMDSIERKL